MKPTIAHHLGQAIRELRIAAGLSQVVFGEKSGLFQTYLSRVENGKANPSLNALEVIAKTLGINIFDLFDKVRIRSQMKS